MATAQNFMMSTPAPDPRLNSGLAGLSGALQGVSNYGDYQKQLQMMQYQNQQKQLTDMMQAGAQAGRAGFGQGPEGSTPIQFGGQQAYWDPNGLTPAGTADMAKAGLYNQKTQAAQQTNPEAHLMATTLLKGIADKYANGADPKYDFNRFQGDTAAAMDYVKKRYGLDKQQDEEEPEAPQSQPAQTLFNGRDASGKPVMAPQSAAQSLFSKATGQASANTPRAEKLNQAVQDTIDKLKKQGMEPKKIKTLMQQAGHDPSGYNI